MVFTVAFESEDNLRKAFDMLHENGNSSTGLIIQPYAAIWLTSLGLSGAFLFPQIGVSRLFQNNHGENYYGAAQKN